MLVAVPLEATEQTAESGIELVRVNLLVCLGGILENLADVLGNLSGLAHVDSSSLELVCCVIEGQTTEAATNLALLEGCQDDPALTLLTGTACATKTVDVGLAVTGKTDLNDVGDVREIHTTRCHIGGEENARFAGAEVVRGAGTLGLGKLRVDLKATDTRKGSVALEPTAKLVENGCGECDFGGGIEVNDGLEGSGVASHGVLLLLQDKLVKRRHDVLETSDHDLLLRDTGMCGLLLLVDTLGEVETRAECAADKVDDIAGNGGGEHKVLALDLLGVGQVLLDLVNLLGETVIQQAVSLVHDQCVQVGRLDARVRVRKDIEKTTGSTNEQMAALALCLLEHLALHGSTDGSLYNETGVLGDLLRLDGDLLSELTGRGDDDGPDVVGLCALVTADLLAELGVACDNALNNGNEETERLAGSGLCLCDAATC